MKRKGTERHKIRKSTKEMTRHSVPNNNNNNFVEPKRTIAFPYVLLVRQVSHTNTIPREIRREKYNKVLELHNRYGLHTALRSTSIVQHHNDMAETEPVTPTPPPHHELTITHNQHESILQCQAIISGTVHCHDRNTCIFRPAARFIVRSDRWKSLLCFVGVCHFRV
jgi:uncharacterized protein (UPF0147 family)